MLDSVDNNQNIQGDPDLSGAGGNQQFLREWDQYQDHWLASAEYSKRKPILLPISVDIDQGVIARDRLKASTIARLQPMMQGINGSIDNAVDAYLDYFDSIDMRGLSQKVLHFQRHLTSRSKHGSFMFSICPEQIGRSPIGFNFRSVI